MWKLRTDVSLYVKISKRTLHVFGYQIMSYTQLQKAIKYPLLFGTSGFGARLRIVLETPARRDYISSSYAKPIDVKIWAHSLFQTCQKLHKVTGDYEKVVKFQLEESTCIKDAYLAKQAGMEVVKLSEGKAKLFFQPLRKDTDQKVLQSGVILYRTFFFFDLLGLGLWKGEYPVTAEDEFHKIYAESSALSYHDSPLSPQERSKVAKRPNDILNDASSLYILNNPCERYYNPDDNQNVRKKSFLRLNREVLFVAS